MSTVFENIGDGISSNLSSSNGAATATGREFAPHLTSVIRDGATPEDLIELTLGVIGYEIMGERNVAFRCTCSPERAISMIASLGKAEVESMIADDQGAVMDCGFCNEKYTLSEADLREIVGDLR